MRESCTDRHPCGICAELIYKASSPDEEALCRAAKDNGIVFIARSTQSITVQVNGDKLVYEVLCSMEFTSDRRRMSVVIRTPEGELKLLTKGADTMMYSRLREGDEELKAKTLEDLDVFSKEVPHAHINAPTYACTICLTRVAASRDCARWSTERED
jgi:magnesium-transporting ATPase (P-type)